MRGGSRGWRACVGARRGRAGGTRVCALPTAGSPKVGPHVQHQPLRALLVVAPILQQLPPGVGGGGGARVSAGESEQGRDACTHAAAARHDAASPHHATMATRAPAPEPRDAGLHKAARVEVVGYVVILLAICDWEGMGGRGRVCGVCVWARGAWRCRVHARCDARAPHPPPPPPTPAHPPVIAKMKFVLGALARLVNTRTCAHGEGAGWVDGRVGGCLAQATIAGHPKQRHAGQGLTFRSRISRTGRQASAARGSPMWGQMPQSVQSVPGSHSTSTASAPPSGSRHPSSHTPLLACSPQVSPQRE